MSGNIKANLHKTALQLFAERGISAVSVRDIAKEMGVRQSTLYRHMSSKDQLITELFLTNYCKLTQTLRVSFATADSFHVRIRKISEAAYQVFDAEPELIRFLLLRQHDAFSHISREVSDASDTPLGLIIQVCMEAEKANQLNPKMSPLQASAIFSGMLIQPLIFVNYKRLPTAACDHIEAVSGAIIDAICNKRGDQ